MAIRQLLHGSHDPYTEFKSTLPYLDFGWGSNSPVFQTVIDQIKPKVIIEVGTWVGKSAQHMANLATIYEPDVEIVCIDTFLGSEEHWTKRCYEMTMNYGRPNIYEQFLSNVIHSNLTKNITPFPIDSMNGFHVLRTYNVVADLIYIDAGHDYNSVYYDLTVWPSLLRSGGILIGDDYRDEVAEAVNDVFGKDNIKVHAEDKFTWQKP